MHGDWFLLQPWSALQGEFQFNSWSDLNSIRHYFHRRKRGKKTIDHMQESIGDFQKNAGLIRTDFSNQMKIKVEDLSESRREIISQLTATVVSSSEKTTTRLTEALDSEDAIIVSESLNAPSTKGDSNKLVQDGEDATRRISVAWETFKNKIETMPPAREITDQRAIGAWARHRASAKSPPFNKVEAEKIAILHGRFKSFTRRRSYAAEWLTENQLERFLSDLKDVYK